MADLVGKTLGRYRVVARLGRGGMAEVYKAYQPSLDRYVAIKVLHSHLGDDKDFIGRFEREALAVGKLRHSNIVQALDFDHMGETYFMAMEFIDGPALKDELKARKTNHNPFTLQETARIFTALCSAIDYAHARGMVHRDIKPANVMINEEGQIVLTDFGIARIVGATQYTQTGALTGTPAYMSPEQGQGQRGDERSDIYSLGVMLYEMVTGTIPYDADTPFAIIMQHVSEPLPIPTKINPDLPESVERVIFKAMSKSPEDRYQTAGEMARALREAVGIGPGDTLQSTPLIPIASPPKIQQADHPTGPITAAERAASAAALGAGATVSSPAGQATTVAAPARELPLVPILVGGGIIIVLLVLAALGGIFIIGQRSNQATQATETAVAIAAATETARQAATDVAATETAATAAALAPEQTAQAAATEAAQAAATATAQAIHDARLVGGVLATAQAATAEVATAQAAVAEAATATALANVTQTPTPTDTPLPTDTPTVSPPTHTPLPAVPSDTPTPTDTPTPEMPPLSGKLAFPVDDGLGKYDVFIVSMPDGKQLGKIQGARQPNFRSNGTKLLVNGEGGSFGENVFEASATGNIEKPVSGAPQDQFPFYKPNGSTLTYSNPELAVGSDGKRHPYLFVQCGLRPPTEESDKCKEMSQWNLIVPAGQIGEVQGNKPVWTSGDRIAYSGCNTWTGGGSCGMFIVGSWATKRLGEGETPVQLVDGSSVFPTDSKAGLIAYQSRETGNWEAYVMGENGGGIVNISNSPISSDGLSTLSPDGKWVAFASDRDGAWAVYVAPSSGGEATKLFEFPKANPWGTGDRDWTNERMSWGP